MCVCVLYCGYPSVGDFSREMVLFYFEATPVLVVLKGHLCVCVLFLRLPQFWWFLKGNGCFFFFNFEATPVCVCVCFSLRLPQFWWFLKGHVCVCVF